MKTKILTLKLETFTAVYDQHGFVVLELSTICNASHTVHWENNYLCTSF